MGGDGERGDKRWEQEEDHERELEGVQAQQLPQVPYQHVNIISLTNGWMVANEDKARATQGMLVFFAIELCYTRVSECHSHVVLNFCFIMSQES